MARIKQTPETCIFPVESLSLQAVIIVAVSIYIDPIRAGASGRVTYATSWKMKKAVSPVTLASEQ